ncbi:MULTISPECIES: sugar phosphate isomerase/epimerase family protein [unclassified Paenibacillus]|uniref:sugar phosphate isomerase/epimerase family protein n=1 Tax=unclassified Paenibacillus TaxID=185978 RepID=UPI0036C9E483
MTEFRGKIAAHAITWGQNHLQAVTEISQLGFRGIEPWASFALQYEDKPEEFKELLAGYGLVITGLYGGMPDGQHQRFGNLENREDIIRHNVRLAQLLANLGADILVLGPGGTREQPTTLEELKVAAETINELAKQTKALGVKACLHPHLWTEIQDQNELETLMDLTDPEYVYLAPDSAHLKGAGMDPAEVIKTYRDRVAYVHLKDLTKQKAEGGNENEPFFCELGRGAVNFQEVLASLEEIQYTGWVTLEVDETTNTPYDSMKTCRDYVEKELLIPVKA